MAPQSCSAAGSLILGFGDSLLADFNPRSAPGSNVFPFSSTFSKAARSSDSVSLPHNDARLRLLATGSSDLLNMADRLDTPDLEDWLLFSQSLPLALPAFPGLPLGGEVLSGDLKIGARLTFELIWLVLLARSLETMLAPTGASGLAELLAGSALSVDF